MRLQPHYKHERTRLTYKLLFYSYVRHFPSAQLLYGYALYCTLIMYYTRYSLSAMRYAHLLFYLLSPYTGQCRRIDILGCRACLC
jgi:hypothetical protein